VILVENILGNLKDDHWKSTIAASNMDVIALDQWEAQKSRFKKTSQGGVDVAVSLSRGTNLRDGDVLVWDDAAGTAIVARISLKDVLVIELSELLDQDPLIMLRTAVELGHAIGNQHWPAVVKDRCVYVPLSVDRKVMASVMKTHAFEGVKYDFVPGSEVIPYLAPHEARRLFGGAEGPVHTHVHEPHVAHHKESAATP